ncbi:MAG: inositol monophosphatase [Spirochaetes bacterium]|nr:inositol monophosphatase [Spirochaetota bacterium]
MNSILSQSDIEFFLNLINDAGSKALQMQKEILDIQTKKDNSLVTEADFWVQNFLKEKISSRFNNYQFICEESTNDKINFSKDTVSVIIDPIDGTAMFSMYLPIWCISIGIFKEYKPLYGFIFSPASNLLFYNDDHSSYLNGKKLTADPSIEIGHETNIFYSSEIKDLTINFPGKIRNLGSTALHAALTADNKRNRLLAFIGKSYLWDWAGAIPVMQKAGVKLKYLDGSDIDYKSVIENNFKLKDYAVAYNSNDFGVIENIFRRNSKS